MPSLLELLGWFNGGFGRPAAAGVVFVVIMLLERAPFVRDSFNRDGLLRAKWKKVAANAIVSLAPAAYLLATTSTPLGELAWTGLIAMTGSTGLNAWLKSMGITLTLPDKLPTLPSVTANTMVFIVVAMTALPGCAALDALDTAIHAVKGANYVGALIDDGEDWGNRWLARHPNQSVEDAFRELVTATRKADGAYNKALAIGEAVAETKQKAIDAYEAFRRFLESLAKHPPDGGAEAEAPEPGPLELPSADEVAAVM